MSRITYPYRKMASSYSMDGQTLTLPGEKGHLVEKDSESSAGKTQDWRTAQAYSRYAGGALAVLQGKIDQSWCMACWKLDLWWAAHWKRILDIFLCLLLLPGAIPMMLITTIFIKLDSPGPVFFKQVRVGKYGQRFYCYKFRSMYKDAEARKAELMQLNEADQVVFKIRKDPRITRVGRIIRKLSIDELPQFFNVLKGDMSLVGPRPPVVIEVAQYEFEQMRRLEAVPGLTGLQQVSGRSELDFQRWVELDVQYIREQSLRKDIEIIFRTVPAVVSGRGAY